MNVMWNPLLCNLDWQAQYQQVQEFDFIFLCNAMLMKLKKIMLMYGNLNQFDFNELVASVCLKDSICQQLAGAKAESWIRAMYYNFPASQSVAPANETNMEHVVVQVGLESAISARSRIWFFFIQRNVDENEKDYVIVWKFKSFLFQWVWSKASVPKTARVSSERALRLNHEFVQCIISFQHRKA